MPRRAIVLLASILVVSSASAQTRHEIIRGRVTTDSGRVIAAADVIATMAPNRETFRATSDSAGRYVIDIPNGTGDYLVYVASPGRRSFRKRVTRAGSDSVFVVDAVLAREVATMAAVRTVAQRTPPPRGDDAANTAGALTAQFGGASGALSPDQIGDLAAMAATVPGIALTPEGGVSAFGLDASQNRATVNGMTFDGAAIPRDLPMRARIYTSSYDPSIGGFGGALVSVEVLPGQVFTLGRGHLALDAPQLQAADRASQRLGQRYGRYQASYGRSGELFPDTWVYSASIQGTRRSADAPSLTSVDATGLERLGVSGDSVARFLQLLRATGVPTRGGVSGDQTSNSVGAAFRIDRAQSYTLGGLMRDTKPRIGFVGFATYNRSANNATSPLAPPSHASRSSSGNFSLQANYSRYFGRDAAYLDEARSAFSYNTQRSSPYLAYPSGFVRVASSLDDGTQSVAGLQFGGGGGANDNRSWRWETTNELSFNLAKAVAHRIKLYTQAQVDGYAMTSTPALGSFTYNSLADLAANMPAAFSRTLYLPSRRGGEVSGAFAIGDYWVKSPELQFVFGPRVEWNAFTATPPENLAVEQLFGARTDAGPSSFHLSPRFGFTWLYRGTRVAGRPTGGMAMSGLGTISLPPKGVLRGGIGEFRSPLAPTLLSTAIAESGLPRLTAQRVSCIGTAVPTANWGLYEANPILVPSGCVGESSFADAAQSVHVFDRSYDAPRRWTGSLTWGSAYRILFYTLDASYSLNLEQPGIVDLNFAGTPRFSLANEANRPVFVSVPAIVPSTGLVSPVEARSSSQFGRVVSHRSDLRSTVGQATLALQPYVPERLAKWQVGGSYTFTDARSLTRGFDGATFGDPRSREWSTGFTPRHQIRANLGYAFRFSGLSLTSYWSFQSGYPYTPIVQGDINGDGLSNDRAFVFNPSAAPSQDVASALTTLLATAPREAHDCLTRQLGQVAGRNSCRRPWTLMMNARADWRHRFGDPYRYANISLNFSNPLAGLDQLLHGSNGLRGWGLPAAPDPTLLIVRGFDPGAQRFLYQVNPRFGNTRPTVAAFYNPFRVSIDVSFSLTPNIQRQQVDYYLRPTRSAPGKQPPPDTILARVNSSGASPVTPYFWILQNADSLLLSSTQVQALTAAQDHYRFRIDSTWRALAIDLAALPKDYNPEAAIKRINDANIVFRPASAAQEGAIIRQILTPIQFRLLPPLILRMIAPNP